MSPNWYSAQVQGAIGRLQAGGRLFLVEQKPYPAPHQVVIVHDDETYTISYNDYALLAAHLIIQPVGAAVYNGFPAEEYVISPDFISDSSQITGL